MRDAYNRTFMILMEQGRTFEREQPRHPIGYNGEVTEKTYEVLTDIDSCLLTIRHRLGMLFSEGMLFPTPSNKAFVWHPQQYIWGQGHESGIRSARTAFFVTLAGLVE